MSQDYLLRFPPTRRAIRQVTERAVEALTKFGAHFERSATRLILDEEFHDLTFGSDEFKVSEPLRVFADKPAWNGVSFSMLTGFGYINLLVWNTFNSLPASLAIFESSSVFSAQNTDPEVCESFLHLYSSLTLSLDLEVFALTRDPFFAPISTSWIGQRVSRPRTSERGWELVVAGIKMKGDLSPAISVDQEWLQTRQGDFQIISEPGFGTPEEE